MITEVTFFPFLTLGITYRSISVHKMSVNSIWLSHIYILLERIWRKTGVVARTLEWEEGTGSPAQPITFGVTLGKSLCFSVSQILCLQNGWEMLLTFTLTATHEKCLRDLTQSPVKSFMWLWIQPERILTNASGNWVFSLQIVPQQFILSVHIEIELCWLVVPGHRSQIIPCR